MTKTIIVSNRLPVRISRENGSLKFQPSEGGLATGLGSIYKQGNNIWLGWPGMTIEDSEEIDGVIQCLKEQSMSPLFLSKEELEEFYLGFSNQTLWPAFHYFTHNIKYNERCWEAYKSVNQKFADAIINEVNPGDTVWIHDYQLLLVPGMVREKLEDVTIGFFQHIPFPSYEVFRMIPWRQELIDGMLGADYIGFHTYDDTRHFLSSCHRLAGQVYDKNELFVKNRLVIVDVLPMGIDYEKYERIACEPETLENVSKFRKALGDQRLLLSVDRLDYSKGIPQRLNAYHKFLQENPKYQGKVSLLLVVVPSRREVASYQALKEELDELVGRINGEMGSVTWTPIHYFYRSFPLHELSAFYNMCDIAMITPLRDGMNLVCKEFIASKQNHEGVLILSEMAGSAKELSDAILVNPNDENSLVNSIVEALEMPLSKQQLKMKVMQDSLRKYSIFNWVDLFMENLKNVKEKQKSIAIQYITPLVQEQIVKEYAQARHRLIFLDYDGTMVPFKQDPSLCKPNEELKKLLVELTADQRNQVVVISGRPKDTLEVWMDEFELDLVAEHGVWMRRKGESWRRLIDPVQEWKEETREIVNFYVDRTPGSFIEEKDFSLVWHYRKVEKGLGELRTRELSSHLKHLLSDQDLSILNGNKVVEVKPRLANKGIAAKLWLETFPSDFILAAGDDKTDEDTFMVMPDYAYSIKIGEGHSAAKFGLDDYKHLRSLIREMNKQNSPYSKYKTV